MTPDRLRQITDEGESLSIEFKSELRTPLADRELLETVVCMANRSEEKSGWVLLGVEDDGTITGARPRHGASTDPLRVQALIANRTRPTLNCRVEIVSIEELQVLCIEVPSSRTPTGTTDGKYLRRGITAHGKPECLPFHFHEMQARQADRGMMDYSALVVPDAQWDDLDPLEFENYRRSIRESRGRGDNALLDLSDQDLAKALGAVEADHNVTEIRVLGLLLFGKEESLRRFIPTHEAAFQVLSRTSVQVNDFFQWPLIRLINEFMARFRVRYREEEIMVGMLRVGVPDYPERAFREGVANALIHRDYTRLGAVHLQWHDDRVEISNPGGFPEGVRLDNILVTPPVPRNPLLADAFKRAGIVERTARGIDTIFYEQLRNGRPVPSYERSTDTGVMLVLPGGKANLEFVQLIAEENQAGRILGLDDLLLLNALWQERYLATAEAARLIQKSEAEARAVLEHLVETGLIESRGERRGRTYHLPASTYKRMGEKAAYIRQRGFEPLQQEQMILQYVERYGRITRREAAGLCQITERQATYLLGKMVKSGKLKAEGKKRATRYTMG